MQQNKEKHLAKIELEPEETEVQSHVSIIPVPDKTPTDLVDMDKHVASVCKEIVQKTACKIQGKQYIQVAGWQAIATAHGFVMSSKDVKRVYDEHSGDLLGWSATGFATDSKGVIRGEGNGFVGVDEGVVKEYVGRAKAQTRSISRCARGMFSQIVVMMDAGLEQTPAEEVPKEGFKKPEPKKPEPTKPTKETDAQILSSTKVMYAMADKRKVIPEKQIDKFSEMIANIDDKKIGAVLGFRTKLKELINKK